jgi:hypothetical protein
MRIRGSVHVKKLEVPLIPHSARELKKKNNNKILFLSLYSITRFYCSALPNAARFAGKDPWIRTGKPAKQRYRMYRPDPASLRPKSG